MTEKNETRINEWFVPRFGPTRFRIFVGLLFLPYTGMCVSFTVIGSLLADNIFWERVGAIALIYALGLGISAHAADTLGSKRVKPWGSYFSKNQLLLLMGLALAISYGIGIYFIVFLVPLLAIIAALEGFFLIAYNFEIFSGRFHNDFSFVVSWGVLPTLAGFVMQTNSINVLPIAAAVSTGLVSYVHIRLSRPYKELKRNASQPDSAKMLEMGLKAISIGTLVITFALFVYRIIFS